MSINALPSEQFAILAELPPEESTSGTDKEIPRVDMRDCEMVAFVVQIGVLGTDATVDVKLREYKASSGTTDQQDISGKAITQLTEDGTDDKDQCVIINIRRDELSADYRYVDALIGITTESAYVSGIAIGLHPSYGPASDHNVDDVAEVVN